MSVVPSHIEIVFNDVKFVKSWLANNEFEILQSIPGNVNAYANTQLESAPLPIDSALGMLMLYKLLQPLNKLGETSLIQPANENAASLLMMLHSPMSFVN